MTAPDAVPATPRDVHAESGGVGEPLLRVRDLAVSFPGRSGVPMRAVDGVSFELHEGEALGLVGESGCGKSLTALSIVRLVDEPPGATAPGSSVRYRGAELVGAPASRLREVRGAEIGFVFQEPMTSLNPVHRVGRQVAETLIAHEGLSRGAARARTRELLARVELPDPDRAARAYPHELSGGMRQRALIAMAIACNPSILIADEPTTALDVTVQAQILELLARLRRETGMALLLISHDLAVVGNVTDRVAVMYAGQIVERGPAADLFRAPAHPYTEGLLRAVPSIERRDRRLAVIPGRVPAPGSWPSACRFHPRCPYAWERCASEAPPELPLRGAGDAAEPAVSRAEAPDASAPPGDRARLSRCWLVDEPGRRTGRGYAEVTA